MPSALIYSRASLNEIPAQKTSYATHPGTFAVAAIAGFHI